jgi:hypothetical protein
MITSIFEDDMIEKFLDEDGKQEWRCKWCSGIFLGWNATNAICHFNRNPKQDIKLCKPTIDLSYVQVYKCMLEQLHKKRGQSKDKFTAIGNQIESRKSLVASSLEKQRSPSRAGIPFRIPSDVTTKISSSNNQNRDKYIQKVLYDAPNLNADSKLTVAIAEFVHCCGLPF